MDTAQRYGCEQLLSVAIQESKLDRDELFLTDKVSLENIKQTNKSLMKGLAWQLWPRPLYGVCYQKFWTSGHRLFGFAPAALAGCQSRGGMIMLKVIN